MINARRGLRSSTLLILLILILILAALASRASAQAIVHFPSKDVIHVPLRWCHIWGSPTSLNDVPVWNSANKILAKRLQRANEIWRAQAGIEFFVAAQIHNALFSGVMIMDPNPPQGFGELGDIAMGPESTEAHEAMFRCEAAWSKVEENLDLNVPGITAVNARFTPSGGTVGRTERKFPCGQQVCEDPHSLGANDNLSMVVIDERCFTGSGDCAPTFPTTQEQVEVTLPHELGHALYLDHGNGVDDDGDGLFDVCCDPDETARKPETLMTQNSLATTLSALQRDRARRFARLVPGAWIESPTGLTIGDVVGDEFIDASNSASMLVGGGLSIDKAVGSAVVAHRMRGLLRTDGTRRFIAMLDLDGNPRTGDVPSDLGVRSSFRGADLVTEVSLTGAGSNDRTAVARIWLHDRKGYTQFSGEGQGVYAEIVAYHEQNMAVAMFEEVRVRFPTSHLPRVKPVVRVQLVADYSDGRPQEVVPAIGGTSSARLRLSAPIAPYCRTLAPPAPGKRLLLNGTGFPPSRQMSIVLDGEQVARVAADRAGSVNASFRWPYDEDAHEIELHTTDGGFGTVCTLEVAAGRAQD